MARPRPGQTQPAGLRLWLTTAFGLIIGIPTLFFYNYFSKKAADLSMNLESASDRTIVMIERYKKVRMKGRQQPAAVQPQPAAQPAPAPRPEPEQPKDSWDF